MLNRFEQFSYVVSGINRYIQKIERDEMEKFGYKGSYAQYLVVLERFDEGVTMSKLCELCDRDKAAVSRVITEMEGKGLVEKKKVDDKVANKIYQVMSQVENTNEIDKNALLFSLENAYEISTCIQDQASTNCQEQPV